MLDLQHLVKHEDHNEGETQSIKSQVKTSLILFSLT